MRARIRTEPAANERKRRRPGDIECGVNREILGFRDVDPIVPGNTKRTPTTFSGKVVTALQVPENSK